MEATSLDALSSFLRAVFLAAGFASFTGADFSAFGAAGFASFEGAAFLAPEPTILSITISVRACL